MKKKENKKVTKPPCNSCAPTFGCKYGCQKWNDYIKERQNGEKDMQ